MGLRTVKFTARNARVGSNLKPQFRGKTTRRQARLIQRILAVQVLLTLSISAAIAVLKGAVPGYSALLGGLIYLLPNLYQAKQVLTARHSDNVRQTLRDLYKSEIWKMALTMVLFGTVFTLVEPVEPFSLFGVFILMQVIAWAAPVIQNQQFLR